MPRKTGVPPEISGSLCTTERDVTRMCTSYCIDPTTLHALVRHPCLRACCHPCRSSAGGSTRLSNSSRLSIDHTGNLGLIGSVRRPAMVRSYSRLEPGSSSNLSAATRTPSSRRLRCRPLTPEVVILSSSAARSHYPPRPEMHAAEPSRLHRPPGAQRRVAAAVRNITVRLELGERTCPRVASGSQLRLRIQRRSKGNSDRE